MGVGTTYYSTLSTTQDLWVTSQQFTTPFGNLSGSRLPAGTTVNSATITITANAVNTDFPFSVSITPGGYVGTNLKWPQSGSNQTATFDLTLTSQAITAMLAGSTMSLSLVGGANPVGYGSTARDIFYIPRYSSLSISVNYSAM